MKTMKNHRSKKIKTKHFEKESIQVLKYNFHVLVTNEETLCLSEVSVPSPSNTVFIIVMRKPIILSCSCWSQNTISKVLRAFSHDGRAMKKVYVWIIEHWNHEIGPKIRELFFIFINIFCTSKVIIGCIYCKSHNWVHILHIPPQFPNSRRFTFFRQNATHHNGSSELSASSKSCRFPPYCNVGAKNWDSQVQTGRHTNLLPPDGPRRQVRFSGEQISKTKWIVFWLFSISNCIPNNK